MSTGKQDKAFEELIKSHLDITISVGNAALDESADFIASNFSPEDIFSAKDLEDWAERNGWTKE